MRSGFGATTAGSEITRAPGPIYGLQYPTVHQTFFVAITRPFLDEKKMSVIIGTFVVLVTI